MALAYARGLEKIYEANLIPVVLHPKRHPHPDLFDRLAAAGVPPAYDRPAPPPRDRLAALPIAVFLAASYFYIDQGMRSRSWDEPMPPGPPEVISTLPEPDPSDDAP